MTFIIPNQETKKHIQTNKNDLSGTIYQSRNINLDDEGYIRLAEASVAISTTDDDADFNTCDAIYPSTTEVYLNSGNVFKGDVGFGGITDLVAETGMPTPNQESDVVYFNGTEVISDDASIYYHNGSAWTSVSMSFGSSFPVVMTVFKAVSELAVGYGKTVKFVNTSWAVNGTVLTLPNEYQVSSMASSGNQLFIATKSKSGGQSMVFVVDAISTAADSAYPCGSFEMPSITAFKSSVVGINSVGQVLSFNGGGFTEVASLPIYATSKEWSDGGKYSNISNRGITTDGDLVYINLNAITSDGRFKILPNFPAGVWCYDDVSKSLYHRYGTSYSRTKQLLGTNITVNATDNDFTLTSGNLNDVMTGMPIFYNSESSTYIPELIEARAYYIIKDSSTVFRLARTYTDAVAGTPINITGTGSTNQTFGIIKTNDYGWTYDSDQKAVAVVNPNLYDIYSFGRLAFTADLFAKQSASTKKTVFCGISPYIPNRGYIITPRLNSSSIEDIYNSVYIKYKPLETDDKIIVKYKTNNRLGFPFSSVEGRDTTKWVATWTDTDTFTTLVNLSSVLVGDEIEIIAGVGSGHIAHVSSISESGGTYTVNLDEAFPFAVANDVFYYNVDNFTKLATITNANDFGLDYFKLPMIENKNSKFLQLKIEMRGVDVCIEEVQVYNDTKKTTV
jgi:hypothetical protein